MKPSDSVSTFEDFVEGAGSSLPELTVRLGVQNMLTFYVQFPAEGCDSQSSDMLLFEWGTYDWGNGKSFELNISRQFMQYDSDGDPNISQLRLVFKFHPSNDLDALGAANHWCESRANLTQFSDVVLSSAPFMGLSDLDAPNVSLSYGNM